MPTEELLNRPRMRKKIRFAATPSARSALPANWFRPLWVTDTETIRLSMEILVRVGNGRLGKGACWIEDESGEAVGGPAFPVELSHSGHLSAAGPALPAL